MQVPANNRLDGIDSVCHVSYPWLLKAIVERNNSFPHLRLPDLVHSLLFFSFFNDFFHDFRHLYLEGFAKLELRLEDFGFYLMLFQAPSYCIITDMGMVGVDARKFLDNFRMAFFLVIPKL